VRNGSFTLVVTSAMALAPIDAFAEVSDKMSAPSMQPAVVLVGLAAFAVCWVSKKAAYVLVPVLLLVALIATFDSDPVLAAYKLEAGAKAAVLFRAQMFATLCPMPMGALAGLVVGQLARRTRQTSSGA
jgi:hypothetical protein